MRTNLAVSRLIGVHKFYMTWALYAFTCETLGQKMMYPDRFPPGADPDSILINKNNWHQLNTPDFNRGVPKSIDEILRVTKELTGMPPLLQISAPYSLAADIYNLKIVDESFANSKNNITRFYVMSKDENKDYESLLIKLSDTKESTDNFFDNVVVNDENRDIKNNRLELLKMFCNTFDNFIDFSKLEGL